MQYSAIFQGYDQNIFAGVTPTSNVAPSATYDLTTFVAQRPDWRVKFGSGSVTLTWAVGASLRGDILVIPMSNLVDGHITLTNGAGLSQNIPVPATLRNALPKTIVVDLSVATPSNTTRTSDTWHLVISGNPSNVTMGACIALYSPKTALTDRDFKWGYTQRQTGGIVVDLQNKYLSRYILNAQTMERSYDLEALATDDDADALKAWFDANNGRGLPGLLWLTPEIEDAFFGLWQQTFERIVGSEMVPDTNIIRLTFTELSKGVPLL